LLRPSPAPFLTHLLQIYFPKFPTPTATTAQGPTRTK
jgi:hypothetical protein